SLSPLPPSPLLLLPHNRPPPATGTARPAPSSRPLPPPRRLHRHRRPHRKRRPPHQRPQSPSSRRRRLFWLATTATSAVALISADWLISKVPFASRAGPFIADR